MTRALVLVIALATTARADAPEPGADPDGSSATAPPTASETANAHLAKARDLHDRGDFAHARDELLAAYQLDPRPELLFALGQIEFNLHHYQAAIDYYERFAATSPAADQAALAQQAIGAARRELARPLPPPPIPRAPPHREWDLVDSGLVVLGGVAAGVGGGLVYSSERLARDHSGTLSTYDRRLDRARTLRFAAGGCFAAGAVAVGAALLRWRFHVVDTAIDVQPTPGGVAVSLERRL